MFISELLKVDRTYVEVGFESCSSNINILTDFNWIKK